MALMLLPVVLVMMNYVVDAMLMRFAVVPVVISCSAAVVMTLLLGVKVMMFSVADLVLIYSSTQPEMT